MSWRGKPSNRRGQYLTGVPTTLSRKRHRRWRPDGPVVRHSYNTKRRRSFAFWYGKRLARKYKNTKKASEPRYQLPSLEREKPKVPRRVLLDNQEDSIWRDEEC